MVFSRPSRLPDDPSGVGTKPGDIRRCWGRLSRDPLAMEMVFPMTAFARPSALSRFFAGVCEYVFQARLGVADPLMVDYLSDLMLRFSRLDTVHRVRNLSGRPVLEVAEMLAEAEHRVGLAKRDVHRHIGDVTLFWTGVYPESLAHLRSGREEGLLHRLLLAGQAGLFHRQHHRNRPPRGRPQRALAASQQPVRDVRLRPGRSPPRMGTPRR